MKSPYPHFSILSLLTFSKRLVLVWKWKEGPNSVLVVCGLHSGLWFWSVHLLRKLASSQILLFVFIYSGLWFWSIKLLCKLYKRVSSHYFYFLFLIFLSLTFHPSFVSYYYVQSIHLLWHSSHNNYCYASYIRAISHYCYFLYLIFNILSLLCFLFLFLVD